MRARQYAFNSVDPRDVKAAEQMLVPKPDPPLVRSRRVVCAEGKCRVEEGDGDH